MVSVSPLSDAIAGPGRSGLAGAPPKADLDPVQELAQAVVTARSPLAIGEAFRQLDLATGDAAASDRLVAQQQDTAAPNQDAVPGGAVIVGLAGGSGREQYVRAQTGQAARAATSAPAIDYSGELVRAVPTSRYSTFADHSWSSGGRYNAPGQSTLYTSPSLNDLKAEVANYNGLADQSVMRSQFDGSLLDSRNLPGVSHGALTEPFGAQGSHRTALTRLTGEDPYTVPRAVGEAARARGLNGVIAPANQGNTNVALFPDNPNIAAPAPGRLASGLTYLDQTGYDAAGNAGTPARANDVKANIPDATPNRSSPAVDPVRYNGAVEADAGAHGRAGGARYGAAGAGLATLIDDARTGRFNTGELATNVASGAVAGHADTLLSRAIEGAMRPPVAPVGVAGSSLASAETNAVGAASRPVGFGASVASGSIISGLVSGGATVWNDADAVASHQMDAGHATADVVVNTGVGLGAGAAGAAAGAAVGSIVPVAGTAVGAVVGFGVGMGASWLAEHSGGTAWLKSELGDALETNFEKPLESAWGEAAKGVDAVKGAATSVEHAASSAYHSATQHVSAAAANVEHAAAAGYHAAASAVAGTEARVATAASQALHTAEGAVGALAHAAIAAPSSAAHAVGAAVGSAVDGAKNAASSAWKTVSGWL